MREGFAGRHAFLRELLTTYGLQVEGAVLGLRGE